MKEKKSNLSLKGVVLLVILLLLIGGLVAGSDDCTGKIGFTCVDNTQFCAIIKALAPASVQPALEDCPTSLIICDGEEIELYWKADATVTDNVHVTGPGGEDYDFPIAEGHATVKPHVSGNWKVEFTGAQCNFTKTVSVRVVRGEESYVLLARGNIDTGFFCDINPKSVSNKLIVKKIRSARCTGTTEYWENWSCKKTQWDGSNPLFFNITKVDGSANCTPLTGRWRFDPTGLGGTFTYSEKETCFQATITCGSCAQTPVPPPLPTPGR